MKWQMHILIIVNAMTVIIVGAYESKRNTNVMFYRKPRSRNFFLNRSFIDKMIGQQTLPAISAREQIISQKALNDVFLKDQTIYSSNFPTFRQPFKQNFFAAASFRDEPLFRDPVLKNQELRGERAILRNYPFEEQSLLSEETFNGQASAYRSQTPFKEQLFTAETPFKNLLHRQSSSGERASLQKQAEFPSISDSIKFYRDDYIEPIDSYGQNKDTRSAFYEGSSMYTEYGNDALELPSMPMIPSSKQLPPLEAELKMPMMPMMPPVPIINHDSPTSSVSSGIDKFHSSDISKMKLELTPSSELATSMLDNNCNASVDSSPTTVPSISVSTNQSSAVGHILTSLTAKPSSPVMSTATSIAPLVGNTLEPIYFHATKHGAMVKSSLPIQNKLNSNVHAYLFSHTPKNSLKINEHDFKFLVPEAPKNDMMTNTQRPMLNILPEEHKNGLKDIQDSFTNYVLLERLKHVWPSQQLSQPRTLSTYIPLSLNGKVKLSLPNIPVAPISGISWPIDIKSDVSTMMPLKLLTTYDTTTSNDLPIGIELASDFMTNIPNNLTPSIPNSISGSITGGISTDIPESMTADMPVSIPTLNLEQSLHRAEQLRQTQEARNPWYPTDLQLQLGGFGGINYTLHTGNPATRPMELGIAKAGLTPPKLSQPHAPAFAKTEVGYHL